VANDDEWTNGRKEIREFKKKCPYKQDNFGLKHYVE
jgi:hypothetical protein